MPALSINSAQRFRRFVLAAAVMAVLAPVALGQTHYLISFVGLSARTGFEPVINVAGELIGAREVINGNVTTRAHRAWVTLEGMKVVHYSDGKVYALYYQNEMGHDAAALTMKGLRFYQADDTGQWLFACAFWPNSMDPYLLCFPDGGAVIVRGEDVTEDRGVERLLVEGAGQEWFSATRFPNPFE